MKSERTRSADVVIIGAGTAGLAAYRAATERTPSVILIEGGTHGTTCARVGCMPSKLLIAAAEAAHHARDAAPFGVNAQVTVDGRAVMARVRNERDRFVGFVVDGVEKIPESHKLVGLARFRAPGELDVDGLQVTAKAVVIATGSAPWVPPMFDAVRDRLVINDDVFAWHDLPASIAVFGGGIIGLELGQALHRLGVATRIFGRGGRVGPLTDPQIAAVTKAVLQEELKVDFDAKVKAVAPSDDGGVDVSYDDGAGNLRTSYFAALLVAAGRKPNFAKLAIENAGINAAAAIDRNTLQWGDSSIFVAGDANGEVPLLHEAADEGSIAGANAARFPERVPGHRRSPLAIAFTDPQIALAGATWAELKARGPFVVGAVSFADQGRSRVIRQNKGALHVYADPRTGRFLGAELAGPRAEHLAHLLAWAHQQEMTIDGMLAMPFYHPVIEEGLRTALRDAKSKLNSARS